MPMADEIEAMARRNKMPIKTQAMAEIKGLLEIGIDARSLLAMVMTAWMDAQSSGFPQRVADASGMIRELADEYAELATRVHTKEGSA